MAKCPACGEANLDGADVCQSCGVSLDFLSQPRSGSEVEHSVLTDRVYMLGPSPPRTVGPDMPVADVLAILVERSIGCVAVVEGTSVIGIFTEWDALNRLGTQAGDLAERPIREFMTTPAETVDSDARIAFALSKMDLGGYRHLPVLREGRISGIISIRDILRYLSDKLERARP